MAEQTAWKKFENYLTSNKSSFEAIKGETNEDIEGYIESAGIPGLQISEVLTEFKRKQENDRAQDQSVEGVWSGVDYRERFENLLKQAKMDELDPRVIDYVTITFSAALMHIRTVEEAKELYNLAPAFPKAEIQFAFETQTTIQVAGPISPYMVNILGATSKEGKPICVKVVEGDAKMKEEVTWRLFNSTEPHIHLVRALDFLDIVVPDNSQANSIGQVTHKTYRCSTMPRYIGSVLDLGAHPYVAILEQGKHIELAITTIHNLNYVHMDIKLSNIFVSTDGSWFLGNFEPAVAVGSQINSYTHSCHPENLDGKPADPKFDWAMFLFALVSETRRYTHQTTSSQSTWDQLELDVKSVPHEGLREFLYSILAKAK